MRYRRARLCREREVSASCCFGFREFGRIESIGMSGWRAVIELDEIWEGDLVSRKVDGIDVLFINIKGEVFAYRDKCPHAGTPLSQGLLEDRVLTCSAHLWQFDIVNGGIGVNPKNCRLTGYPVKVEDGKVLVQIRASEAEQT
jgi:toluene monooxygenase system ferredoxin subunit